MQTTRSEYSEKRDFIRLAVDCDVYYQTEGGQEHCGQGRDLSAGGVMFEVEEEFPVGTKLHVRIHPRNNLTPPLETTVEVLRMESTGPGKFLAGCQIVK
jgi:hypothetical protein